MSATVARSPRLHTKRTTYADNLCTACGVFSAVEEHRFGGGLHNRAWCRICRANIEHSRPEEDPDD